MQCRGALTWQGQIVSEDEADRPQVVPGLPPSPHTSFLYSTTEYMSPHAQIALGAGEKNTTGCCPHGVYLPVEGRRQDNYRWWQELQQTIYMYMCICIYIYIYITVSLRCLGKTLDKKGTLCQILENCPSINASKGFTWLLRLSSQCKQRTRWQCSVQELNET